MKTLSREQALSTTQPASGLKPVKAWAFVGVLFLSAYLYSVTRWLLGGYAKPSPKGPDSVPGFMSVGLIFWQAAFLLGTLSVIYFVVIRPWRRERRLTYNGLVLIAIWSVWFQDPFPNYSQIYWTYNNHGLNLGCPQCFLPGWQSHAANFAEGIWPFLSYPSVAWTAIVGGCWLARRAQALWQMGYIGTGLFVCGLAMTFDFVTELVWILPGQYQYGGGGSNLPALFKGEYYQFPIHAFVLAGAWYTAMTLTAYFKNDKGETIAERGLSQLELTPKRRTGLRVLALIGAFNTAALLSYNAPFDWASRHWNSWPKSIQRSYFTNGNCGPGTDYACPDPKVPMPIHPSNSYINPEGKLVTP